MSLINYKFIHDAGVFYESKGFVRIEAPWTVTEAVSCITKPKGKKEFKLEHDDGKVLVASAEQSFLYLYLKNFLPKGTFQATTPCFRREAFDSLHTKYFMKTELIDTLNVNTLRLDEVVNIALEFFSTILPSKDLKVTGDGLTNLAFDIEYKGIELGSYGIRSCDYLEWIYGTGIAEPRVSNALLKTDLKERDNERWDNC